MHSFQSYESSDYGKRYKTINYGRKRSSRKVKQS